MTTLKIVSIVLKPVEIVLLVAGFGLVIYYTSKFNNELILTKDDPKIDPYDLGEFGRNEFFLYTTVVGVAIAVLGIVSAVSGLLDKKYGALGISAVQAIWTVQLLVSTALVAKILITYQKEFERFGFNEKISQCEIWDKAENRDYDYNCSQLAGGVACGFLAMVAFAVDTAISFASYTRAFQ